MKMVENTTGDILEVGGGLFSTPYLHFASKGRTLITLENDKRFYDFEKQFGHDVRFIEDWDSVDFDKRFSFIFFDHAPAERRAVDIRRWMNKADYIVVHDTELTHEYEYNYKSIYPLFKYHYKHRDLKPHTSVLSNVSDPSAFFV